MSGASAHAAPDGAPLYVFDMSLAELPPVTRRELEKAWIDAGHLRGAAGPRRFRFNGTAEPVELLLADRDAASWAAAVERLAGLNNPRGVSLCLRLLGLVALMAGAAWVRPWFSITPRGGVSFHPALLQAAALAPLDGNGGFDETALRALLPPAKQGHHNDG